MNNKTLTLLAICTLAVPGVMAAQYAYSGASVNDQNYNGIAGDELTLQYHRADDDVPPAYSNACGEVVAWVEYVATGANQSLGGQQYYIGGPLPTQSPAEWAYTPTAPGDYTLFFEDTPNLLACPDTEKIDVASYLSVSPSRAETVAGDGGGNVRNVVPVFTAELLGDQGQIGNDANVVELFTASIYEGNREADLTGVSIESTAGWSSTLTDFTPGTTVVPAGTWTVIDTTDRDGHISFEFRHTWPEGGPDGTFSQTFTAFDEMGGVASANVDQTQVLQTNGGYVEESLYDVNGVLAEGNWGLWDVLPGATSVDTLRFIKVVNEGSGSQDFTVAYAADTFNGTATADYFAIDGNLGFQLGTGNAPADGMTDQPVDGDGMATYTVPADSHIWLGYYIAQIPDPQSDDEYLAPYTVAML